jgi:glycosyltransferase involved in cell wall biosynthesis
MILPNLGGGGSERVVTALMKNLDRHKFDLHLALLDANHDLAYELPEDLRLTQLKCKLVRHSFGPLLRLIRREKPNIILSSVDHLNLMVIALKPLFPSKTKLAVRSSSVSTAALARYPTTRFSEWWYRSFYRRADLVICQTNYMRRDFQRHFQIQSDKLARIYNPLDFSDIESSIASQGSPFPTEGPNLVFAGRLVYQKGVDILINAFESFSRNVSKSHLWILGSGPLENELIDRCSKLGISDKVHFAGFQSNPYVWFRHADLFVLPSRFEGLPNALLEALACGCSPVATDSPGGTREVMEMTGNDSRLLAIDRFEIHEDMLKPAANPCEVKKVLEKNFSLQQIVSYYEIVLKSLRDKPV